MLRPAMGPDASCTSRASEPHGERWRGSPWTATWRLASQPDLRHTWTPWLGRPRNEFFNLAGPTEVQADERKLALGFCRKQCDDSNAPTCMSQILTAHFFVTQVRLSAATRLGTFGSAPCCQSDIPMVLVRSASFATIRDTCDRLTFCAHDVPNPLRLALASLKRRTSQ